MLQISCPVGSEFGGSIMAAGPVRVCLPLGGGRGRHEGGQP